jgi:transcriptional regulator with XRE-family HTH domain
MKNPLSRQDVGTAVSEARNQVNMTQEQLGQVTGLGQAIISRIEAGARKLDFIEIVAIADALGVDVSDLLLAAHRSAAVRSGDPQAPNYELLALRLREEYSSEAEALAWLRPFLERLERLETLNLDG